MVKTVIGLLGLLTFLSDIFIVLFLLSLLIEKTTKLKPYSLIKSKLSKISFELSFIVSLVATLGSLFISEVAKYSPCLLCWYQRIAMYPQTLLLYTGILRKEKVLKSYLYVLNVIGAIIALYHYFIQIFPKSNFINCEIGGTVSCTKTYTLYFGYISIPFMALTAFVLIILLLSMIKTEKKNKYNFKSSRLLRLRSGSSNRKS